MQALPPSLLRGHISAPSRYAGCLKNFRWRVDSGRVGVDPRSGCARACSPSRRDGYSTGERSAVARARGMPGVPGLGEWVTLAHAADRLGLSPAELRQRLGEKGLSAHVHHKGGVTVLARGDLDSLAGKPNTAAKPKRPAAPAPTPPGPPRPRQGTWPVQGVLEARQGRWSISDAEGRCTVQVDEPAPSCLVGRMRPWLITYRGRGLPKLTLDRRTPAERRRDAERLAQGKSLAAPQPAHRSVRTISGGLPGLGKRR